MTEQMSKAALLNKIRTRQVEFESVLAPLNEAQMTTPGVNGEWSIKDILAHIVAWQRQTIDRLQAAARHRQPSLTPVANEQAMDALNVQFYQENKDRPLSAVLADLSATHMHMLAAVEVLTDEDLDDPYKFAWRGGEPLWQNVAGNTYEHIDEHIEPIQQWLASKN
ncbi:MAG: hypothetical protein NVS4B7_19200 [Ktedonobacteraceae bacterium]